MPPFAMRIIPFVARGATDLARLTVTDPPLDGARRSVVPMSFAIHIVSLDADGRVGGLVRPAGPGVARAVRNLGGLAWTL